MDPLICPVTTAPSLDPRCTLDQFRSRFRELAWAHESPDTLLAPVFSTADSIARFEDQLVALFTAHLKMLDAASVDTWHDGPGSEHARRYRMVREFCADWPSIGGMDPVTPELLRSTESRRLLFGRPDVVMAADGPRVVETNFDTGIAGFEKPDDLWTITAALFELDQRYLRTGRPIAGLVQHFDEVAGDEAAHVHWLMKNDSSSRREYDHLIGLMNTLGRRVRHRVYYAGEPLHPDDVGVPAYLHRACALLTVNGDRERFAATLSELAPAVRGCTVPVGLSQIESKVFLAWLSDPCTRPTALTAREIEAVTALVPFTRFLKHLPGDQLERVRNNRGDFIVKKTDSYQALHVFFGCNLSQAEWSALLDEKAQAPEDTGKGPDMWIVQERVRPKEYHLLEYTDAGAVERRTGLSSCPYVLGGRIRAMETWVTPFTPQLDMIRRMQFVPHFIRTECAGDVQAAVSTPAIPTELSMP